MQFDDAVVVFPCVPRDLFSYIWGADLRGETCVSSVSVPVPEESPFFVVFLCKKAICKPLLDLFL